MRGGDAVQHDYLDWRHIDYQPVVAELLPTSLLQHLKPGQRVLEVGCGRGGASVFLAKKGLLVEGVDLNPEAVVAATMAAEQAGVAERVRFLQGDFITCDPLPEPADAVVLIRVLTCFPDRAHWSTLLDRAWRCLGLEGLLYVRDFLLTPANYSQRYDSWARKGCRYGTFGVPKDAIEPSFMAHHHSEADLSEICRPGSIVSLKRESGVSMTGNSCRTFELIARNALNNGTS